MASYTDERWFKLLADAVSADPRGAQGVADRMKVSRTMISLVLGGKYKNTRNVAQRVLALLDNHPCPYLGMPVQSSLCLEINSGPAPIWDPAAMDQRRTCQTCPNKPERSAK